MLSAIRLARPLGIIPYLKLKIMKSTLLAILFALVGDLAFGQSTHRHAPERVRQAFGQHFPEAKDAHWAYNGGHWNATFDDRSGEDRGEMVAHFDAHGRYIDSDIPYAEGDVPQPVMENARKHYHGHFHVTRVDHPSGPDVYQVRGTVNGRSRTYYYDEQGGQHSSRNWH